MYDLLDAAPKVDDTSINSSSCLTSTVQRRETVCPMPASPMLMIGAPGLCLVERSPVSRLLFLFAVRQETVRENGSLIFDFDWVLYCLLLKAVSGCFSYLTT